MKYVYFSFGLLILFMATYFYGHHIGYESAKVDYLSGSVDNQNSSSIKDEISKDKFPVKDDSDDYVKTILERCIDENTISITR